jgi:WD40 repeat protein
MVIQIESKFKRAVLAIITITFFLIGLMSFAQMPKLVVQAGHPDFVNFTEFSNNGKMLLSVSNDNTMKLWDVSSGKELNTFEGHSESIILAKFSPNDEYLVSTSKDKKILIWNINSQKLIHTWVLSQNILDICYLDSKTLTYLDENGKIYFLKISSGVLTDTINVGENSISFVIKRNQLIVFYLQGLFRYWDINSRKVVETSRIKTTRDIFLGFSDKNNLFAILKADNSIDVKSLFDTNYRKNILPNDMLTLSVTFTKDSLMATYGTDKTIYLWNLNTEKSIGSFKLTKSIKRVSMSANGNYVSCSNGLNLFGEQRVRLWDINKMHEINSFSSFANKISMVCVSPDSIHLAGSSYNNNIFIWNMRSGKISKVLKGHIDWVESVSYSNDGKLVISESQDNTVRIWDAETGNQIALQDALVSKNKSISFSPQNEYFTFIDFEGKVCVKCLENDSVIFKSKDACIGGIVSFLNSNRYVIVGSGEHIKLLDIYNIEDVWVKRLNNDYVSSIDVSNDGKKLAIGSESGNIIIVDSFTGIILTNYSVHDRKVVSISFSNNDEKIVSASYDKKIAIWNIKEQKPDKIIIDSGANVESVVYNFNNSNLICSYLDGLVRIRGIKSDKQELIFFYLNEDDYIILQPESGFYDGTPVAREFLYFTCGTEIIDLDQMKDALYVPGLVEKINKDEDINYPKLSELNICNALPLVEEQNNAAYSYKITQRNLKLDHIEVYINNKLIYNFEMSQLKKQGNDYFLIIEEKDINKHFISGADNDVNVVAVVKKDGKELKSRGAKNLVSDFREKETAKPSLFAVMIGVNDYKDDNLDLNYPAKDATDLGKAITHSAGILLGQDHVTTYNISTNSSDKFTTPEKEGIRKALEDIGKKAQPQDIIMIFFAGHGIMQGDGDKKFMFLTAEASEYNPIGITTDELQYWLSYEGPHKILANKTILIFDACNSGQATHELLAMTRNNDETERIRQVEDLKDKSGMFILAASAAGQSAYELPQYEQGLLTYSLLYTIKNKPDILDDGKFLNVQKWFLESEKYLHEIIEKMGYDQDAQPYGTANIRIGEVNDEVRNNIKLASEKPVMYCANVMNSASFADDLNLKEKINTYLEQASKRGENQTYVFVKNESSRSNLINIQYTIKGEKVSCNTNLFKNGTLLYHTLITGNVNNVDELVKIIIDKLAGYATLY